MNHNAGFTLIEVIVTVTIAAIAATLLMVLANSLPQSTMSVGLVAKQYALIQQMEEITSEYRKALDAGSGTLDLVSFKQNIVEKKTNFYSDKIEALTSSGTYTTKSQLLQVTLKDDGGQTLFAIFTSGQ